MNLLNKSFQQTVMQFQSGDIPAAPKMVMCFYMAIEEKLKFDTLGFIDLDDLFEGYTFNNRDRYQMMSLLKRFKLIKYENMGNKKFKVWLLPKSKVYKSGDLFIHNTNGYRDMMNVIGRLNARQEEQNKA